MFGINPDLITYIKDTLAWVVRALQQIATKEGITLPPPPAPPQD